MTGKPWRQPLGALRLTLADESGLDLDRARAECEELVLVLNQMVGCDCTTPRPIGKARAVSATIEAVHQRGYHWSYDLTVDYLAWGYSTALDEMYDWNEKWTFVCEQTAKTLPPLRSPRSLERLENKLAEVFGGTWQFTAGSQEERAGRLERTDR
jgi:hypothetical protein